MLSTQLVSEIRTIWSVYIQWLFLPQSWVQKPHWRGQWHSKHLSWISAGKEGFQEEDIIIISIFTPPLQNLYCSHRMKKLTEPSINHDLRRLS